MGDRGHKRPSAIPIDVMFQAPHLQASTGSTFRGLNRIKMLGGRANVISAILNNARPRALQQLGHILAEVTDVTG
ncbi:hypothetical protein AMTR_s00076p00074800 [Amborella trichopoda]|uniref:Uncharacterized protein n=1 Tax=Amborella trichopoda TaxID=13333 RepID=W1P454_AMBTC|nr:hypothetical protein AMTR_s00076p00074800 [Amborella trichopoda]